jgi:1-acyl-sn-glycerol-3-phosphate acyltransferase
MSDFVPENSDSDSEPTRLRPNVVWRLLKVFLTPFFRLWVRTHAIGTENIDDTQGGLLLLNHQSFLDPLAAGVHLKRPISFLAREELFKVPVVGWVLRKTYTVSVSQTAFRGSSIRGAIDHMHQGFLVGVFPEGERTSGPVKKFNRGFLALVRRVDLPIYPVGIVGADDLMPVGAAVIRPGKVTVVYGKPLNKEERELLLTGQDDKELTEMMRQRVADCMEEGGFRLEE